MAERSTHLNVIHSNTFEHLRQSETTTFYMVFLN